MTLTQEAVASISLSGPAALVASIPALVGFVPDESLVAVWLKDGQVLVTQRADVVPAIDNPEAFFGPMRKHQPDEVILVFWTNTPIAGDGGERNLIEYAKADVAVRDALWVANGRWGSLECSDSECCPHTGHPIDNSLGAVVAGISGPVASHRETLLSEVKPEGTKVCAALNPREIEAYRDKAIDRARLGFLNGWLELKPEELHKVGRSLHDIRVRDALLYLAASLDTDECREAYGFAAAVTRQMHPADAAPAATVAAILAWMAGDGARANVAIDEALRADEHYSLAGLLQASLSAGLPPSAWRDSMAGLSYDDCRYGANRV